MTEREQISHFEKELNNLVERYGKEYELTYASIIGVLVLKVHALYDAVKEQENE